MDGVARSVPWVVAAMVALLGMGTPLARADARPVGPPADPGAVLAQLVQDVGGRGATARLPRYAYLSKLDSHLQDVAASRLGAGSQVAAVASATSQGVTTSATGEVAVDVYVNGSTAAAADALRALGMRVTAISGEAPQRMVEGFLPPAALPQAAALGATHGILAPLAALSAGSVTSQGVAATHATQPQPSGATGAGVTVGVISDSINKVGGGIAASQTSGDLPANTVALSDASSGGTDEGRAMAEISYDEAPGLAGILFATANGGPGAKAAAIDSLVSHGAKVIADDTSYITEPFFQDDVVAQAVDRAKAAGTAYFAAAGNDAQESWQGTFDGTASEDFDPGPGVDPVQSIGTLQAHQSTTIVLQWAEPWGAAVTDLALDVYSIATNGTTTLLGTADTNNLVTGIPEEAATITAGGGAMTYGIGIRRVAGVANPLMKFIDFTNGAGTVTIEHPANGGAVSPDAASAAGALTVAASRYPTPTTPETFSSRGPVTHSFDASGVPLVTPEVLQKPDLAAPDGVSTSLGGFTPFYGTSAATPAAAGIAALILSANPAITVDELYAIMTNPANALACTPTPLDCGAGFVLADRALGMALDRTPPLVTPTVAPAAPDGDNGWYRGPVGVTWTVSDGESPITAVTGCAAASPADGTTTLTCSATSAGGTTTVPITIKRDSTPPPAPVIAGVASKTYAPASLPAQTSLKCTASDPISGIATCTISGYGAAAGRHTLTAVAVDTAGLSTSATLGYSVAEPPAISQLKLAAGLTLTKLARSGARLSVRVAGPGTRLAVTLAARVGARTIALGRTAKRASKGTIGLRVTLTARARQRLATVPKATLEVVITGTSASGKRTRLHRSLVSRRA